MSHRLKKIQFKNNFLVVILFFVVAMMSVYPLYHTGYITGVASDAAFHFSRVEQIFDNLKRGSLSTFIATDTFHHTGVGSFLFYPTIFLYPWAFLRFFLNPVAAFYSWYGLLVFVSLLISYFSMKSFSKNNLRSLMFAFLYTFAMYKLRLGMLYFVLGEFIASTFLPLAFLGFYHVFWGDSRKWPELVIGITLVGYSHFLSLFLTVIIFSILLICKLAMVRRIEIKRLFALLKSVGLTILTLGFIVWPFLTDYIGKNLKSPPRGAWYVASISDLVNRSLTNNIFTAYNVGFFLIVGVLIGWYFVKKDLKELYIYLVGLVLLLISTNFFPWEIVKNGILGTIQFPYRLHMFASLMLAVSVSFIIERLLEKNKKTRPLLIMSMLILFGINYTAIIGVVTNTDRISFAEYLQPNKIGTVRSLDSHKLIKVDKNNYENIFQYGVTFGESDYYPQEAVNKKGVPGYLGRQGKLLQNIMYINGKARKATPIVGANTLTYVTKVKGNRNLNLPVIAYTNTIVKLNGVQTKYTISQRGTVVVKTQPGVNRVTVEYQPKAMLYILLVIAIASWIFLIYIIVLTHIKGE